jgi:hypothetical protein
LIWQIAAIFVLSSFIGGGLRLGMSRVVFPLFVFVAGVATASFANYAVSILPWYSFLLPILVGIAIGYVLAWIWSTRASRTSVVAAGRVAVSRLLEDFRVSAVLIGLILSYAITFYFARMAFKEEPPGFWIAFYASWVAGLLFFTIVGLIAGLVALYRPERDVFAARVKILTGGKSGSAVDYIASELRRIGYVAKRTKRTITIEAYDAKSDTFKTIVKHETTIRNIYDDVATTANGNIRLVMDVLQNAPQPYGQLLSFRINGANQGGVPLDIDQNGLVRAWTVSIPAGGEGQVEYEHWCWYLSSEVHEFTVNRFTEELLVEFKCRCRPSQKRLVVKLTTGNQSEDHLLDYDGEYRLPVPSRDLNPGTLAYSFRLGTGS